MSNLIFQSNFENYEKIFYQIYLDHIVEAYQFLNKFKFKIELPVIYRRHDFKNMSEVVNLLKFIIYNFLKYPNI